MGSEKSHLPVKLVLPAIYSDRKTYNELVNRMMEKYGETDYQSEEIPFDQTEYYVKEMGFPLYRRFHAFKRLIAVESLVDIKKQTNAYEMERAVDGKRKVNLDPGYLSLGKLVLATTKNHQHRLYIRNGIFEEITLYYRNKRWNHFEWTYPDYRQESFKNIFLHIREIYYEQIQELY